MYSSSPNVLVFRMSHTPMISHLTARLFQGFTIATLTTASLLTGYPGHLFTTTRPAIPVAAAEESSFTRYVRAVHAIEQERKPLIAKVKAITNGNMPDNVCGSGFSQLPGDLKGEIRNICNAFNGEVNNIIARHGFANNPGEFNRYQQQAMSNDRKVSREMQKRIAAEMNRIGLR
jgi:hypothetical protein